ncbi:hypothetical protein BH11BAC4_BH11BAC4_14950 [soil metagenome]
MFRTFKATISGISVKSNPGETTFVDNEVLFTRSKIKLTEKQKGKIILANEDSLSDGTNYLFTKDYNRDDKKTFFISTHNGKYKRGLSMSILNRVKANFIHNQYWIQREYDWVFKYIISALLTVAIALYANRNGFNRGFQEGLKVGKSEPQSIPQKK